LPITPTTDGKARMEKERTAKTAMMGRKARMVRGKSRGSA
jgi:hypothetical protein